MIEQRNEYVLPGRPLSSGPRAGAAESQSSAGDPSEFWTELLQTGDPAERLQAIRMLGALGRKAAPAVPALAAALHDDAPRVRRRAIGVLADLGPLAYPAVPDLVAVVHEAEERLRFWAVFTLGEVGPAAAVAVPTLRQVLRDSESTRLRAVVRAALKKIACEGIKCHGGAASPGRPHHSCR